MKDSGFDAYMYEDEPAQLRDHIELIEELVALRPRVKHHFIQGRCIVYTSAEDVPLLLVFKKLQCDRKISIFFFVEDQATFEYVEPYQLEEYEAEEYEGDPLYMAELLV